LKGEASTPQDMLAVFKPTSFWHVLFDEIVGFDEAVFCMLPELASFLC
jgi:hypothetical protein